jgi:predicted amidophosphoribosyltransferase
MNRHSESRARRALKNRYYWLRLKLARQSMTCGMCHTKIKYRGEMPQYCRNCGNGLLPF